LLQALIFADANAIKENSVKLGAGEDLYALFAGILTMRPWNRVVDPSVDHLVVQGSDSDRSELQVIFCPRNLSLLIVSTSKNSCQIYMLIKLHTLSLSQRCNHVPYSYGVTIFLTKRDLLWWQALCYLFLDVVVLMLLIA
jgi:hypothetical protein